MPFAQITPIRQLVRAYAAILNIDKEITSQSQSKVVIDEMASLSSALTDRLEAIEQHLSKIDTNFDQRVAGVLREHIYLPPTSHWSADKPFLPFSTCSAADFIHPLYAQLCETLAHPIQFHRKVWEWVFVLHHLEQMGVLKEGFRGVGFGVGTERLPSIFANLGAGVVATDAPAEIGLSSGWTGSGQHSDTLNELFYPDLVSKELFNSKVSHRFCDMNAIDADLKGFDFTWSCCSFEHLGSLEAGMQFVINSVENTLKPGGVAVHTTEFNLSSNDETIDSGPTVLYRRRDMEELAARLTELGNEVQPFVVAPDSHFLDFHVDLPPYSGEPHLKLKFGRHVTTSAGIVVRKRLT
jgi:hypothetical protein